MSSSVIRRPSAAPERTTKSPCTHAPCSALPQASRRSAAGCRDSHAVSLGQATPAAIARSSTSNISAKVRGTPSDSETRATEASGELALRAGVAAQLDAAAGCPGRASWFSRHPLGANRQASATAPPTRRTPFPSGSFIPRWGHLTASLPGCPRPAQRNEVAQGRGSRVERRVIIRIDQALLSSKDSNRCTPRGMNGLRPRSSTASSSRGAAATRPPRLGLRRPTTLVVTLAASSPVVPVRLCRSRARRGRASPWFHATMVTGWSGGATLAARTPEWPRRPGGPASGWPGERVDRRAGGSELSFHCQSAHDHLPMNQPRRRARGSRQSFGAAPRGDRSSSRATDRAQGVRARHNPRRRTSRKGRA